MHTLAPRPCLAPLLACSALALGLLLGRVAFSGSRSFLFLAWNLALAWAPFACSQLAARLRPRSSPALLLGLGLLWLLFFPNAPYLVTDLLHLHPRPLVPLWYDLGLLLAFAWCGLLLGIGSLDTAHRLVRERLGPRVGWVFVGAAAGLGGLGIYLGRFGRWNSWDLIVQPGPLLQDLAARCTHPLQHARTFGVSGVFGALILMSYLAAEVRRDGGRG